MGEDSPSEEPSDDEPSPSRAAPSTTQATADPDSDAAPDSGDAEAALDDEDAEPDRDGAGEVDPDRDTPESDAETDADASPRPDASSEDEEGVATDEDDPERKLGNGGSEAAGPTEASGSIAGGTDAASASDAASTTNAASTGDVASRSEEPIIEGPESDEEMPLAVHIEEMMLRLGVVFLFAGAATLVAFPYASDLINYFWGFHIPEPQQNRPRLYGPLELVLTRLKVAGLAGLIVGLPVFVYETYRFMRPGLYRSERRYYLAAVPTSLVLGTLGILFAHFLVLPAIFSYFTAYTTGAAVIAFGLAETFNLILIMMAFMAIVFQIPLFIMLAIMMNIVTRRWLEDKRLVFWGSFLGIAFIFSPDPTGMAPIIVTLTMIALYEGTLALLRWTGN